MKITRHDIPETVSNLIKKAMEIEVIDSDDLISITINNGYDWKKIVDEIVFSAFSSIHFNNNHEIICPYAEKFWKEYCNREI